MKRQRRASTTRRQKQIYTQGQLNRLVDDFLHPIAKISPELLVLDGILHGIIEQNPPESLVKFIDYNLPKAIAQLLRNWRRTEGPRRTTRS